jgi:hypothetical protein
MSNKRKYEPIETYRYNNVCKNCKNIYYYFKDEEYAIIKCEHNVATCLLNGAMHFVYRKSGEELIKSEVPLHICKNCKNTYYYLEDDGYVIKCRHNMAGCLSNDATHFAYRKPGEEIIKSDVILSE